MRDQFDEHLEKLQATMEAGGEVLIDLLDWMMDIERGLRGYL